MGAAGRAGHTCQHAVRHVVGQLPQYDLDGGMTWVGGLMGWWVSAGARGPEFSGQERPQAVLCESSIVLVVACEHENDSVTGMAGRAGGATRRGAAAAAQPAWRC